MPPLFCALGLAGNVLSTHWCILPTEAAYLPSRHRKKSQRALSGSFRTTSDLTALGAHLPSIRSCSPDNSAERPFDPGSGRYS
ncbi:hypothetical protein DFH06DRAFT_689298 [Mycena polygramma]|nr:hypothetical protein DFH06DRAFT_689298 [Mycena polygramma]